MTDSVTLSLDGHTVVARPDDTLFTLAQRHGVSIPTLCHEPRLAPDPSCWICVVEVAGPDGGPSRLEPACGTRVSEGLVVQSRSARVDEARRTCVELLLSDHYADCMAPCAMACPAQVDIPGYVRAVEEGRWADAVRIVRRTNPLPSVCGRVCPHPCEVACHRNSVDAALAINPLKRLATERGLPVPPPAGTDTGRRVAVIGAGPAGLTAAWFLRLAGHRVTVFDAQKQAGGMLRYGIPRYRLPTSVLDVDIAAVCALGVELEMERRLGVDLHIDPLLAGEFSAVFVALGAWRSRRLSLDHEDALGVQSATDFLRNVEEGSEAAISGTVAVIGGGNTAVDAARTALRLGAQRVCLLYRRAREHMPAFGDEVEAALAEGVELTCLVSPAALHVVFSRLEGADRLEGLTLQHMRLDPAVAGARPRPVPIEGSTTELRVDQLLTAIGEQPDLEALVGEAGNKADPATLETARAGVFAGGDFVTGPATAVEAIAAGRRAAYAIDAFLRTGEARPPAASIRSQRTALSPVQPDDYAHVLSTRRVVVDEHNPAQRVASFNEVEQTLEPHDGMTEALRCLQCSCSSLDTCSLPSLMRTYGADPAAYRGGHHRYPPERPRAGLALDMNKCIRCARCVRVCTELAGVGAWSFIERGFDTRLLYVAPVQAAARAACDTCLQGDALCVDTCPTAALTRALPPRPVGPVA